MDDLKSTADSIQQRLADIGQSGIGASFAAYRAGMEAKLAAAVEVATAPSVIAPAVVAQVEPVAKVTP